MPDFDRYPALACKNCSEPIALPTAMYPHPTEGLGSWPKDGAGRNFLCLKCNHVFAYSGQDVRQFPYETTSQISIKPSNVVCLEVPCGVNNCPSLLRIRTLMPFEADPLLESLEVFTGSTTHAVHWDGGHIHNGTVQRQGTAHDAYFDPLWLAHP
jgi:hypothetical protein